MSTEGRSNWERADSVASGVGTVARGIGWVMVRIYALALIAIGLAALFAVDGAASLGGLVIIGYGVYLMFGGSWIVY